MIDNEWNTPEEMRELERERELRRSPPVDDVEAIAQWIETLHCDRWKDVGCWKHNCTLFRTLADDIREREWNP